MKIGPLSLGSFQRVPISLLLENGELISADGGVGALGASGDLTISRALCRFQFYRAPSGLPVRDFAKAARLRAEADAPFAETGSLIVRAAGGAAIWYWDQAQIAALLANARNLAARIVPESLQRGQGEGWRIIETKEGFEAQSWRDGGLIASTWRRRAFSAEQWRAFALSVEDPAASAPDTPPEVSRPPLAADKAWRSQRIGAPWSWREAEEGARMLALCAAAIAAFTLGQAVHYDGLAHRDENVTQSLRVSIAADPGARRAKARMDLIDAYQHRMQTQDVMGAAAEALQALNTFAIEPTSWSIDGENLRLSVPYSGADTPLHDMITALENAPHIHNVTLDFVAGGETVAISAKLDTRPGAATTAAAPSPERRQ